MSLSACLSLSRLLFYVMSCRASPLLGFDVLGAWREVSQSSCKQVGGGSRGERSRKRTSAAEAAVSEAFEGP